VLVTRPAYRAPLVGPSEKAGRSHLPLPTQERRKIPRHQTSNRFWGCCRSISSVNGSPGRECLVAYRFVTTCANCSKQFGVLWVMDLTRRVAPETVARITCPLCGNRFDQDAKDLLQIGSQIQYLVVGRPVRDVEVDYDCPHCSNRGISVSLLHTDLSWEELSEEHMQTAVCDNDLCPQRGLVQKLKPSRVVRGALNPITSVSFR